MSYFPLFLNFEDKQILIVGGGEVAHRKLIYLLDFTTNISLISKDFNDSTCSVISKYHLLHVEREYHKKDIEKYDIVIVATDNIELQSCIYLESKNYKCLVNCVDSTLYCDFIFPSYIKKDDLTIAISTSGSSPAFAKEFKKYLLKIIPQDIEKFLRDMKKLRETLPKGNNRMELLREKAKKYIDTIE